MRYVEGERRLLMLLTGRGPGGMSAPVDGLDGAIPIVANAGWSRLQMRRAWLPGEDGGNAGGCDGDDGGPALGGGACGSRGGV